MPVGERTRASVARLRVRVVPGARCTEVVGRHGDAWKVRVHAPAERGHTNEELVELLADVLSVPASELRIVGGHTGRDKMVEISGLPLDDVETRLGAAAGRGAR